MADPTKSYYKQTARTGLDVLVYIYCYYIMPFASLQLFGLALELPWNFEISHHPSWKQQEPHFGTYLVRMSLLGLLILFCLCGVDIVL